LQGAYSTFLIMEKCMKSETNSMVGGVIMLCGLVVLLSVPMIIGHYALPSVAPVTVQADASNAH
jgi:hypothetical protein